jgi:hypothetical protein
MAANPGALRFNTDSLKMELFDGNQWVELVATSADSQTGGARGLFAGAGVSTNNIDYVTISTTGNAIDFGDLLTSRQYPVSCSSRTRGLFSGGYTSSGRTNLIDYITISSTGNAQDFGDLTVPRVKNSSLSSQTRGIIGGGNSPSGDVNVIDYVTIASEGTNAQDFGDLTTARAISSAGCSSSTRGLLCSK